MLQIGNHEVFFHQILAMKTSLLREYFLLIFVHPFPVIHPTAHHSYISYYFSFLCVNFLLFVLLFNDAVSNSHCGPIRPSFERSDDNRTVYSRSGPPLLDNRRPPLYLLEKLLPRFFQGIRNTALCRRTNSRFERTYECCGILFV